MPGELIGTCLQQRRYQLLSIKNGLSKVFLNAPRSGRAIFEFKLPSISEHLHLPINPAVSDICSSKDALAKVPINHDAAAHSKVYQVPLQPKKRLVKWTTERGGNAAPDEE
jgi:hypothetical protein